MFFFDPAVIESTQPAPKAVTAPAAPVRAEARTGGNGRESNSFANMLKAEMEARSSDARPEAQPEPRPEHHLEPEAAKQAASKADENSRLAAEPLKTAPAELPAPEHMPAATATATTVPLEAALGDEGPAEEAEGSSVNGGSANGGSVGGGSADSGSADSGSADGGSADGGFADGGFAAKALAPAPAPAEGDEEGDATRPVTRLPGDVLAPPAQTGPTLPQTEAEKPEASIAQPQILPQAETTQAPPAQAPIAPPIAPIPAPPAEPALAPGDGDDEGEAARPETKAPGDVLAPPAQTGPARPITEAEKPEASTARPIARPIARPQTLPQAETEKTAQVPGAQAPAQAQAPPAQVPGAQAPIAPAETAPAEPAPTEPALASGDGGDEGDAQPETKAPGDASLKAAQAGAEKPAASQPIAPAQPEAQPEGGPKAKPILAPSAGNEESAIRPETRLGVSAPTQARAGEVPQAHVPQAQVPRAHAPQAQMPPAQPPAQPTAQPTAQPPAQPIARPVAQPIAQPTLAPSAGGEEEGFAGPETKAPGDVSAPPQAQSPALAAPLADAENVEGPPASPAPLLSATLARFSAPGEWNRLAGGLLARNNLSVASGRLAAPSLGRGEGADPAAVNAALDQAKISWPAPFRKQVGLGLVALGRPGLSPNSMTAGASLMGASSTGEILQSVLGGLKGEISILKLPPSARDDLGRILAGSGLGQERLGRIMAGFGRDGLPLKELDRMLSGVDLSGRGRSLTATTAGLAELGQFLGSLGASTEVIDQVLNGLTPGQPVTGEVLRDIFSTTELGGLARDLAPGDIKSLAAFLQKMGAAPDDLARLETRLMQTSGQLTMGGFLDFLDGMKEASGVSGRELEGLKKLLEQVQRDTASARTPIFNEILIKLEALGDSEIDGEFVKLSPALQALRGGFSSANDFSGGSQFHQGQHRENQERYRQAFQAMTTGQDGPVGASSAAQAGGYGGLSESLARQISQKITYSRRRGLHRLKMNLNPAELGRLDIELTVKGGALTARIRAESRAAYEALGGGVAELKKALAEGGVELAGLTLDHEDADSGRTFTSGLSELAAENKVAKERAAARSGEVNFLV